MTTQNTPPTSIHSSFLPFTDPEASLAFYRDVLGFEVRLDVGQGHYRWLTVGPKDQPDTAIVLHPVLEGNGITDQEHAALLSVIAKGSYFGIGPRSRRGRGHPGADRPGLRSARLRGPRSRGQPHPHPAEEVRDDGRAKEQS
jgi:catechol 2,3-dioxygenase-like lactoylglutathione lyase family enzyme